MAQLTGRKVSGKQPFILLTGGTEGGYKWGEVD